MRVYANYDFKDSTRLLDGLSVHKSGAIFKQAFFIIESRLPGTN
jgi:hypothetical protein